MKKTTLILLSLLGLGILGVVGYYGILIWSFKDFGMPPWPNRLYEVEFNGHKERLEQALLATYKAENLDIEYRDGNYFDLNILSVQNKNNTVTFEFAANNCKPIKNWVNYGWAGNCKKSIISLYRIFKDSELIYDFNDDKKSYPGIKPYLDLFDNVLVNKVKVNINNFPLYTWNKSYSNDSSEVSVFVISESQIDTIAKHKFQIMFSNTYGQIFSEKYFGDSIIRYDYDEQGHYISGKCIIYKDNSIKNEY
jgi:hypothetical protein